MRPDAQLDGAARPRRRHRASSPTSYLKVATGAGPGAGITADDDAVPRHRGSLHGSTAPRAVATLYSDADTATAAPRRHPPQRRRQPAGRPPRSPTTSRARSSTRARATRPGPGRSATARPRRSAPTTCSSAPRRLQPDWSTSTRSRSRRPTSSSACWPTSITQMNLDRTPLPRFWYLPRGGKAAVVLTGDDHGNGGTAGQFDPYEADEPRRAARWPTGSACARPPTSSRRPRSPTRRRGLPASRIRDRAASSDTGTAHDFTPGGARRRPSRPSCEAFAREVRRASPRRSPTAPTASRGATGPTQPKAEREHGIRLDTNYYYWPAAWVQNRPGMFTGSGLPDALRRHRRLADRRLPGGDPDHRRVGHRRRRAHLRRCSTAPSGPRASTASSPRTCTPTAPTTPGPTRSSPRRRRAACRSSPPGRCSTGSTAATARRSGA